MREEELNKFNFNIHILSKTSKDKTQPFQKSHINYFSAQKKAKGQKTCQTEPIQHQNLPIASILQLRKTEPFHITGPTTPYSKSLWLLQICPACFQLRPIKASAFCSDFTARSQLHRLDSSFPVSRT